MVALTTAGPSKYSVRPYAQGRRAALAWNGSAPAFLVREPEGWLYRKGVRRAQLDLRIALLERALTRHPEDRDRLLEKAGSDPFFHQLTGYEQRLVIRALDLSRAEAQALFL